MPNTPYNRVTTIRESVLTELRDIAYEHGITLVDALTYVVYGVLTIPPENRENLIYRGMKVEGMIKLGGELQPDGSISFASDAISIALLAGDIDQRGDNTDTNPTTHYKTPPTEE